MNKKLILPIVGAVIFTAAAVTLIIKWPGAVKISFVVVSAITGFFVFKKHAKDAVDKIVN